LLGGIGSINYDPPNDPRLAAIVGIQARLGYEDGAHLLWRSSLGIEAERVVLAETRVSAQVPVNYRVSLLLRGYHGRTGLSGLEVGGRFLVIGNGGRGSWFVHFALGAIMVFSAENVPINNPVPDQSSVGPALALGSAYRF